MPARIIDVGNSRVHGAFWPGPSALPRTAVPGEVPGQAPLTTAGKWTTPRAGEALPDGLVTFLEEGSGLPAVLVSVVPHVTAQLAALRPDLVVVDHRSTMPFTIGVTAPAAVGADRYCNVAAACAAGLTDALIVDAGTATTFDLLVGGCFQGGFIAPGMGFAAQKLGETAARLDPVPFEARSWEIGKDTAAAMAGGAWHVGVGGVLSVIAGILEHHGPRTVILTGGLGHHIRWDTAWHDPFWTLRGAAFLAL